VRIYFLACDFPPALGGIQKLTHGLSRALAGCGEAVHVFATAQPGDEAFDATSGVPTVRCHGGGRVRAAIGLGGALRRAVANGEERGVVVATKWSPEGHAYLMPGTSRRMPMVLMGYGREFRPERHRRMRGLAQRMIIRAAAGAIAISRYTKRQMVDAGIPEGRVRVVPPAIDPAELLPPPDAGRAAGELGWPAGPTLLTVARLVRRKGVDTVIEALPRIVAAVPDVQYVVVGDGPEKARLADLSRELGVESRVHFVGAINDRQKAACFHLCDVFAMPSRDIPSEPPEGFGIVYLEANACGKPVIAARTGGVEDAVEHEGSGLLVEPDSPTEVAEAAVQLLREPEAAQTMGARGKARVLERFAWDTVAPQFAEAVRSLV
jgi:phosphatidylinositol alpha-1,6-mannosyltransferase